MNRSTLLSLALAVLVLLCGWLALRWFLSLPGKADHDAYLLPETSVRLVFQPSRVQDYVSSLAPQVTKFIDTVPRFSSMQGRAFRVDWIHKLPHEITFLYSRLQRGSLEVLLYVNEIPEADSFSSEVNDSGALDRIQGVNWNAPRLAAEGLTQRVARGSMFVPPYVDERLAAAFPVPGSANPPVIEGNHFFEFAADNADGGLLEWQGAMRAHWGDWGGSALHQELEALWPSVASVRLAGDLDATNRLLFTLEIELNTPDAAGPAEAAAYSFVAGFDTWFSGLAGASARVLEVESAGTRVRAAFEAEGFEARIRRALGS
jgi:hypothetical protein